MATLARKAVNLSRNTASDLMVRFDELGVFDWKAAPRGSHGISELSLPALDMHRNAVHVDPVDPMDMHRNAVHVAGQLVPDGTAHAPRRGALHKETMEQRHSYVEHTQSEKDRHAEEGEDWHAKWDAPPGEAGAPGDGPGTQRGTPGGEAGPDGAPVQAEPAPTGLTDTERAFVDADLARLAHDYPETRAAVEQELARRALLR